MADLKINICGIDVIRIPNVDDRVNDAIVAYADVQGIGFRQFRFENYLNDEKIRSTFNVLESSVEDATILGKAYSPVNGVIAGTLSRQGPKASISINGKEIISCDEDIHNADTNAGFVFNRNIANELFNRNYIARLDIGEMDSIINLNNDIITDPSFNEYLNAELENITEPDITNSLEEYNGEIFGNIDDVDTDRYDGDIFANEYVSEHTDISNVDDFDGVAI